ncbi:MFS transporter [Rahnella sp. EDr1-12]|uniref:MFS transporter n=1 Tax=unclassified Rahnella TaxID=2635087 RepID=UPI003BAA344B
MSDSKALNMPYVWMICLVAACGGLLFGYDWVVIGGAKPFYEAYFGITDAAMSGWAMSSALLGCVLGAAGSGTLSDRYGRRLPLIIAAVLFTASGVGTALADSFNSFVFWRIVGGVGIGLASALAPVYIAEISPAEKRGRFVAVNQLTIVLGVLAAQLINLMIAEPVASAAVQADILQSWNGQTGWRYMFGAEAIPAAIFLALMFVVPESPRWLAKANRYPQAEKVLQRIGSVEYARETLAPVTWVLLSEIFPNRVRGNAMAVGTLALWIACFLLTYTFPLMNAALGAAGSFFIYAVICLAGWIFIQCKVPETRGVTLEVLEQRLSRTDAERKAEKAVASESH